MSRLTAAIGALILTAGVSAAHAQPQLDPAYGDPETGREFALQTCALCHLVERGQLPPRRMMIAPAFRDIANTRAMTPRALRVFLFSPHARMPNLLLTRNEADDVIAYIMTLRTRGNPRAREPVQ
jgi:mono/diheme cytochrome c family protein